MEKNQLYTDRLTPAFECYIVSHLRLSPLVCSACMLFFLLLTPFNTTSIPPSQKTGGWVVSKLILTRRQHSKRFTTPRSNSPENSPSAPHTRRPTNLFPTN